MAQLEEDMPHIVPITAYNQRDILGILADPNTQTTLRLIVSDSLNKLYVVCQPEEIAIIPRVLTGLEHGLASNMLPLEFKIEFGIPFENDFQFWRNQLRDSASTVLEKILTYIPYISKHHFGVWVIYGVGTSFAEHKPTT